MNSLFIAISLLIFTPVLIYSQLINDLQVNTDTNLSQPKYNAKISTGKDGTSVVVWEHRGATTSNVYAHFFSIQLIYYKYFFILIKIIHIK